MDAAFSAFLPLGMIVLMFVLGLRLTPREIIAPLAMPRVLGLGLVIQMLGLPLLAWVIGRVAGLPPALFAGFMLAAAAPGGVTSNYIAYLVRADLALSVTMTVMTSLAISISLPLVLALAQARLPGTTGLGDIGLGMAQVTVLPIAAGMALRAARPEWAARLRTGAEPLGKTIFAILVLGTFVQNRAVMQEHFVELGAPVVMLNLGALVLGRGIPALAGVDAVSARAIMVETSLQNVAVTIFVASTLMGRPDLAVPGLLYAVVMNVTALILIGAARRFRHPVL
jgi:BASS family bile acid:Na+ symporter